jgi:transcriptional regulator with XRE-family HTH domain
MSIAENLKKLRKSKGWTQVELAEKLSTTQQVITSYETGKKKPPIDRLTELAAIFDVSIEEIIGAKHLKIKSIGQHIHKNSRSAKIQNLFDKLPPLEQKVILKQVRGLLGNISK